MPLAVTEGANPIWGFSPIFLRLGVFANGMPKMSNWHSPIVTHKPLDLSRTHQFGEGQLERLGKRLHNIRTNVIHGAFLDEGIEEPGTRSPGWQENGRHKMWKTSCNPDVIPYECCAGHFIKAEDPHSTKTSRGSKRWHWHDTIKHLSETEKRVQPFTGHKNQLGFLEATARNHGVSLPSVIRLQRSTIKDHSFRNCQRRLASGVRWLCLQGRLEQL